MRKEQVIIISAEGRDNGKAFKITEMAAMKAEKWATRALLALAKSGADIPEGAEDMGFAGIATVGLKAFGSLDFYAAEPLLDEMMTCVQCVPDPNRPEIVRGLVESDLEEVKTIVFLRGEVLSLHMGFSLAEKLSEWKAAQAAKALSKT